MDWLILTYTCVVTLLSAARTGSSQELIYRVGCSYDILLSYFVFRGFLRDAVEVREWLIGLAVLVVPLAVFMVIESVNGYNVFRFMGTGYEATIIRDGHYRCQGSFRGPITSGVFGATLVPLFVGLYRCTERRVISSLGVSASSAIAISSHSSGPLMALLSSVVALAFWRLRRNMRTVRRAIVVVLIGLHLSMKVPVWFIFSKLSDLTGGDGWHRSELIDQAIHHFGDWWLVGTMATGDWMPTIMADGSADLTNQYVASGVTGGLLGLAIFVWILARSFRQLGELMSKAREGSHTFPGTIAGRSDGAENFLWCLGAALFAHVVTMFSVTYFDQMHVAWWALLAMISGVSSAQGMPPLRTQDDGPLFDSVRVEHAHV